MAVQLLYDLYKDDYGATDDVEDGTLSPRNPTGDDVAIKVKKTTVDVLDLVQFGVNVNLDEIDAVFIVWDQQLASYKLQNRDKLTHDGTRYMIIRTSRIKFDTQWQCICREEKNQ